MKQVERTCVPYNNLNQGIGIDHHISLLSVAGGKPYVVTVQYMPVSHVYEFLHFFSQVTGRNYQLMHPMVVLWARSLYYRSVAKDQSKLDTTSWILFPNNLAQSD